MSTIFSSLRIILISRSFHSPPSPYPPKTISLLKTNSKLPGETAMGILITKCNLQHSWVKFCLFQQESVDIRNSDFVLYHLFCRFESAACASKPLSIHKPSTTCGGTVSSHFTRVQELKLIEFCCEKRTVFFIIRRAVPRQMNRR